MKIGFIGCGNMGGALAKAVSKSGYELLLCDQNEQKALELSSVTGGCVADGGSICRECDYVFLGVKPNGLVALIDEIKVPIKEHRPILVSMLAGVDTGRIGSLVGEGIDIIRIMPNTPVLYGEGLVLISADKTVKEETVNGLKSILKEAGVCEIIEENLMDAASAVSGSGPAFFYRFIEAVALGGVDCGLGYEEALRYATLTAKGAAVMIMSAGKNPEILAKEVCSPGGSTIEGVSVLDSEGLAEITRKAVVSTYKKAQTLGRS